MKMKEFYINILDIRDYKGHNDEYCIWYRASPLPHLPGFKSEVEVSGKQIFTHSL